MQALNKVSEALSRMGGNQVTYRISAVRQELQVDQRPGLSEVKEFAEFLQAEGEELALMASASTKGVGVAATSSGGAGGTSLKAVAMSGGANGGQDEKSRGPCRFWGTSNGCRRGDTCSYTHLWDGVEKKDRCYVCSGVGHFSKDCPTKKARNTKQPRVAKVKGAEKEKDSLAKGEQLKAEEQRPTSVSGSPARPKVEDPIPNGDGGQPHGGSRRLMGVNRASRWRSRRHFLPMRVARMALSCDV